jgi:D-beta-D-heptose 7-phosphate kinase/D-beta-D-heptose 1-phosphate adenosyltransferase
MLSLVEQVRAFRDLRVAVVGDVMLDSYVEGTACRLCTEAPVPVVQRQAEQHLAGGAANSAANLAGLGAEVALVGVVGDDGPGAELLAALGRAGLDDRWLVQEPGFSTLHKLRVVADGQYLARVDVGGRRVGTPQAERALLDRLDELLPTVDLVLVADYRYGVLSDTVIGRLRRLRGRRAPLVIDSKALPRYGGVGAALLTPNHREALLAVEGAEPESATIDLSRLEAVGRRLLVQTAAAAVAITLGPEGVLLIEPGRVIQVPGRPVTAAHDVGAGDTFAAAAGLALATGCSAETAVGIGIEAAAIAVGRPRTAVVQLQELLQRVSLQSGLERRADGPSPDELLVRLDAARAAGQRIVFTNGVFDLLHAGHLALLRQARELGDLLVVAVNTDRSAERLKGGRRPITGERDRLALVAALEAVDFALLFDEDTPSELIRTLRPDVHVKGGDYANEPLPEAEAVRAVGGEVVILPLFGEVSTTRVIERVLALAQGQRAAVS